MVKLIVPDAQGIGIREEGMNSLKLRWREDVINNFMAKLVKEGAGADFYGRR